MPIDIITPIPEVCDRYTIAKLKLERVGSGMTPELRQEFEEQIAYYADGIDWDDGNLVEMVEQLYELNAIQWNMEGELRAGLLNDADLIVIGRLALAVRDINCKRTRLKNTIQEHTGSGFHDIKMNYGVNGVSSVG